MKQNIYLDHAATTATRPEVLQAMLPYFNEQYGNPSSIYTFATNNLEAIAIAREQIATAIHCKPDEIYFTSGGTEADNWALLGIARAYSDKGKHIITTKIEHHAILNTCRFLEELGYEITYLDVDEYGIVKLSELKRAIRQDTILISVMYANNEIGTIQPIKEIGQIAKYHHILFHTDAVQAFCQLPINVEECHIDLLSMSGHKIYGPKGVGCLYIRSGVKIRSLLRGGAQERHRRAGTENVPGIIGMGTAVAIAMANLYECQKRETKLRNYLINRIMTEIPYARLNGHPTMRLANNINVGFQFVDGESILIMLDLKGICASGGSACTSGSLDPSHVLLSLGLPDELARGSIRLTLGEETTKEELDYTVGQLKEIITKLRSMSPQYDDFIRQRTNEL